MTGDHMLTPSSIFCVFISSTLVSDLYGLMQCILYLLFIAPYCNSTVPLVKHCVITNDHVYGVSYSYAVCLVSIMVFLTLYS